MKDTDARQGRSATRRRLPARLAELTPDLEAATRGRVAFFDPEPGAPVPPARATGDVILPDELDERGAWVPLSALKPGPRGTWTLLVVAGPAGKPTLSVEAAEILHLDGGRAYMRGSFADGALYLDPGLHRVVQGRAVALAEARSCARPSET